MPIRRSERARYPVTWRAISQQIKERAGWACEGVPGSPCGARHGECHPMTGAVVVLTVAHLDHTPEHNDADNLRALCQRCHNRYDQRHRQLNAARTRRAARGTRDLFDDVE